MVPRKVKEVMKVRPLLPISKKKKKIFVVKITLYQVYI